MCAYKLVTIEFKWFGFQSKVESFVQKVLLTHLIFEEPSNNCVY